MPLARAIRSAVQWVVSTGRSASVSDTTRAATSGPSGGMREGRVLLAAPLKSIPTIGPGSAAHRRQRVCEKVGTCGLKGDGVPFFP